MKNQEDSVSMASRFIKRQSTKIATALSFEKREKIAAIELERHKLVCMIAKLDEDSTQEIEKVFYEK
jgi:hypothetical protein